jgi:aryl-alcohol dehydrogenase-like predicted oxidoreductase
METRKLGFTDLNLTTVGLGTWAIGGEWRWGWGPQDEAESIQAIQKAIDLGINWIDTAPAYGLGTAEKMVGKAVAGRRDQVIIATKCGLVGEEGGWEVDHNLTASSVRKEVEASLRRLNVDVIDLYQIHWPNPDEQIEEGWGAIADMIKEGKVRYGGVSNFSVDQIKRVQAIHPVASLQPPYSMLERTVEEELLEYCAANQIGVVAYSPMYSGLLTGKYNREQVDRLAESDWRREDQEFQEPRLTANLALVEKLTQIAERHGYTMAQLAIAWTLRRPEVTSAIVGARRPSQIETTAPAADWHLTPEVQEEIDALLAERDRVVN